MKTNENLDFAPDWVSPPGDTLRDILEERGQTAKEFARALKCTPKDLHNLLEGSLVITPEVADNLSKLLGISAEFWLSREAQFRAGLVRLADSEQWLRKFPINELRKLNWLPKVDDKIDAIGACLDFFGEATVADWNSHYAITSRVGAFRTSPSFGSAEGAVLAWLRKGEIEADLIECANWNPERFRSTLPLVRTLTRQKNPAVFVPELQNICAESGVALVVQKAPSGCKASGVARFISDKKALLMLSFRYLSDDHFWFTFFHEAGHLLLHDLSTPLLEGEHLCSGLEEKEANAFSADVLVAPSDQPRMRALPLDGRAVMRFAREIGISPGIVVGQLQHLGVFTRKQLNNLKVGFKWDQSE